MSDTSDFASAHRLRSARSRHREAAHDEAHGDDAPAVGRAKTPDLPLVPRTKPKLIADDESLAKLVADLAEQPAFAYDSEFIGESTYHPKLCLIQVATPTRVALIDPLADLDLSPFWNLIGDGSIRKIVHAGEQDLEPVIRLGGVTPANVFDTQIAAGFCGLAYPASLAKLVEYLLGVHLGKGLTFTQWDQRPLSPKQLAYAADDVRYLPAVAAKLDELLGDDAAPARRWALDECRRRASGEHLGVDEEPWQRVRGGGNLGGPQGGILRELAAWRDAAARSSDLPPRALVKDEVLIELARRPPKTAEQLAAVRHLPRPVAERFSTQIFEAIDRGRENKLPRRGPPPEAEATLSERHAAESAFALLNAIAAGQGIDPTLLSNRRDGEAFARAALSGRDVSGFSLMHGWRGEAAGRLVLDILRGEGRAGLSWSDGRLRLA